MGYVRKIENISSGRCCYITLKTCQKCFILFRDLSS